MLQRYPTFYSTLTNPGKSLSAMDYFKRELEEFICNLQVPKNAKDVNLMRFDIVKETY